MKKYIKSYTMSDLEFCPNFEPYVVKEIRRGSETLGGQHTKYNYVHLLIADRNSDYETVVDISYNPTDINDWEWIFEYVLQSQYISESEFYFLTNQKTVNQVNAIIEDWYNINIK